jgi:hypothetical protein
MGVLRMGGWCDATYTTCVGSGEWGGGGSRVGVLIMPYQVSLNI